MGIDDTWIFQDHTGRNIRLTQERHDHLLEHPEMSGQVTRIQETLENPQIIVATVADQTVHVYHRHYASTPVTSKYLLVAIKIEFDDAFVLTAFFSSRQKKGVTVWKA
ncbi:MAG: PBECR2 nuclease fold domain-containing protein [Caldilineaceae bacterium]